MMYLREVFLMYKFGNTQFLTFLVVAANFSTDFVA